MFYGLQGACSITLHFIHSSILAALRLQTIKSKCGQVAWEKAFARLDGNFTYYIRIRYVECLCACVCVCAWVGVKGRMQRENREPL